MGRLRNKPAPVEPRSAPELQPVHLNGVSRTTVIPVQGSFLLEFVNVLIGVFAVPSIVDRYDLAQTRPSAGASRCSTMTRRHKSRALANRLRIMRPRHLFVGGVLERSA